MSDSAERNCDKCIHNISGNCDSWDCKMQTVEDVKKEAVNEYVKSVVEELELHSFEFGTDTLPAHYVRLNDAIEIVKQGCVDDDVCEWKQTSTAKYKTSCGYKLEEYFDTKACYCKQCGKKIKIVGD